MQNRKWAFLPIVQGGLLAGTLDILCAMLHFYVRTEKNPINVLVFIASGVFGKEAFAGGLNMAAWGILFHYVIAFCWAAFFFALYPRISWLSRSKIVSGLSFGVFIWLVVNQIVVPLSRTLNFNLILSRL